MINSTSNTSRGARSSYHTEQETGSSFDSNSSTSFVASPEYADYVSSYAHTRGTPPSPPPYDPYTHSILDVDGRRVAVAVAEQWVSCVHCTMDNPPEAMRCEVCFGSLVGFNGAGAIGATGTVGTGTMAGNHINDNNSDTAAIAVPAELAHQFGQRRT
jgi:hypothetical protein